MHNNCVIVRRLLLGILVAMGVTVSNAQATGDDWLNFAGVSTTMGIGANRLCLGEDAPGATNPGLGCPSYAPSVTTAGDVSVTGNLSANAFIGDGSGLTGIALGDSITSGTTNITANEDTSLTFTTAGSQRMVIDENGNVGIGTASPAQLLDVYSTTINPTLRVTSNAALSTNEPRLEFYSGSGAGNYTIAQLGALVGGGYANPLLSFRVTDAGRTLQDRMVIDKSGNVGIGTTAPSTSLHVHAPYTTSVTRVLLSYPGSSNAGYIEHNNGNLNIGTTAAGAGYGAVNIESLNNFTLGSGASSHLIYGQGVGHLTGLVGINTYSFSGASGLEVSGTFKVAGGTGSESCGAGKYGLIRRDPTTGRLQMCRE